MKRLILLFLLLCPANLLALDVVQNVARSFIIEAPVVLPDGTPQTGLTPSSFTVNIYPKNKKAIPFTISTCVYASSTLTSSGIANNNETLTLTGTLDNQLITETYTFKTTLTGAANEILIGAAATNTLDNIKSAINDTGVEGTAYGNGTAPSVLVNATTKTATTLLIVANIPGAIGNDYTTAETMTNFAFTGSTLASGNSPCMIHDANGYYWFGVSSGVWNTLGDTLITFSYTNMAPLWQKIRVVANSSNDANVRGITATVQAVHDLPASIAGQTAGSIGNLIVTNLDKPVSDISGLRTIPANTDYNNFTFRMFNNSGTPLTGLTVACQVSKDGAVLSTCINAPVEVGGGVYKIDIPASDLNVTYESYFIFTATGARPMDFKINVQR